MPNNSLNMGLTHCQFHTGEAPSQPHINISAQRTRSGGNVISFGPFFKENEFEEFADGIYRFNMCNGRKSRDVRFSLKKNGSCYVYWRVVNPHWSSKCSGIAWIMEVLRDRDILSVIPLHRWKTTIVRFSKMLAIQQDIDNSASVSHAAATVPAPTAVPETALVVVPETAPTADET